MRGPNSGHRHPYILMFPNFWVIVKLLMFLEQFCAIAKVFKKEI